MTYRFDPIVSFIIVALNLLVFTINTSKICYCVKQNIIGYKYLVKYCKFSKFMTNRVYIPTANEHNSDAIWTNNWFICSYKFVSEKFIFRES